MVELLNCACRDHLDSGLSSSKDPFLEKLLYCRRCRLPVAAQLELAGIRVHANEPWGPVPSLSSRAAVYIANREVRCPNRERVRLSCKGDCRRQAAINDQCAVLTSWKDTYMSPNPYGMFAWSLLIQSSDTDSLCAGYLLRNKSAQRRATAQGG